MILPDIRSAVHRIVKSATGIACFGGRITSYEIRELPFCDIRFPLDRLLDPKNGYDEREVTCEISIAFKPLSDTELESMSKSSSLFEAITMDEVLSLATSEILQEKTQFLGGMEGSTEVGHLIDTYKIRYCRIYPEKPLPPLPTDILINGEPLD